MSYFVEFQERRCDFCKITAFLAEIVDQSGLSDLLNEIVGAFGMILGMTGACALLLIISLVASISAVMPV